MITESEASKAKASCFRAHKTGAAQGVAGWTTITFETKDFDLLNEFLNAAPWTFTPIRSGYYLLITGVEITFAANQLTWLRFRVNGAGRGVNGYANNAVVGGASDLQAVSIVHLNVGDAVDVQAINAVGVAQTVNASQDTFFAAKRIF
jgi:hypothetical protein